MADNGNKKPVDPVVGKSVAEVLGEIVWLMSQDEEGRKLSVADIERVIMPAVLLRQFHIQYAEVRAPQASIPGIDVGEKTQNLQPIKVEVFAMCSDVVAAAIDADPNVTLSLPDWRSGTKKRTLASFSMADKLTIVS
ncbi:MAG: toxin-activating lysine-acyltransferase [Pseudomonadota bacterium]